MENEKEKARPVFSDYQIKDLDRPTIIAITVALLLVLITSVLLILWHRKKVSRRAVLLTGLSNSGKTLIYSRLLQESFIHTQTSVKENTADYMAGNHSLKIVDIPGHERLRGKFFDEYKTSARGIVYVIDSEAFQRDLRDVAEYLYTLLSDSVVAKNYSPFLILCNKQDQTMAKGSSVIKALLEKEMNLLRTTKSSQLESTNETANNNTFLGKKDKDFEFGHLHPMKVEFGEASALNEDTNKPADLESLLTWLVQVAN